MQHFQFLTPFSEKQPDLKTLLQWAWFRAEETQISEALNSGVLVDGFPHKKGDVVPEPGSRVAFSAPSGTQEYDYPDWPELLRGDGFVVLDKSVGASAEFGADPLLPVLFAADACGYDRNTAGGIWAVDPRAGGPWMMSSSAEDTARISESFQNGNISMVWEVLVTKPLFGSFEHDGIRFQVSAAGNQDGVAALQITPQLSGSPITDLELAIRTFLSLNGSPIVGDSRFGGVVCDGRLRIRLFAMWGEISGSWNAPEDWWPGEIVVPVVGTTFDSANVPSFEVSSATMRHLVNGHPWVLRDRDTSTESHEPGALVQLVHEEQAGPLALYTGEEPIIARVWGDNEDGFDDEIETRFDEALAIRQPIFRDITRTDIFRIVHGEADAFPGIFIDRLGPVYRATIRSECAVGFRDTLYDAIQAFDPGVPLLEVWHTDDIRRRDELPEARVVEHGFSQIGPGEEIIGREHGLRYHLDVWEGIDPGFFADQRENRTWILEHVEPHAHWLNLFCHTGAFSVALASKGATTENVDLSQRYLDRLHDNLSLNDFPLVDHRCHAQDARTFVQETEETFDGIIVDPPTASSGEGGFWSVQKDYEKLLVSCLQILKPGGRMLVCSNVRKKANPIESVIASAAKKAKTKLILEPANPSIDYPYSPEFPEGRTFTGVWVIQED